MSEIYSPGSIAGPVGPAGPPANFAGTYSNGTTYSAGQAISYTPNGNSYVSLAGGNAGNQPDVSPAWWGLLASSVVASEVVSSAQLNTAISTANQLPMYYATAGSTTATFGATGLTGTSSGGGTTTGFLIDVLTQGSNVESITLQLGAVGTSIDVIFATINGSTVTIVNRLTLTIAEASQISPGIYQWTAPANLPMFRIALPNTYFGVVQNDAAGGYSCVDVVANPAVAWRFEGDPGAIGNSFGIYTGGYSYGLLAASIFTRVQPPVATPGAVAETRTLCCAALKGYSVAPGGTLNIFSASGPGNIERIQIAMCFDSGSPSSKPVPAQTVITIVVDGQTYTAPLGMFMLWNGYTTSDGAGATADLFVSRYLGITTGTSSGNAWNSGYRRIYIKYNSSISISLTTPTGGTDNATIYTQVESYPGAAPFGRYPATRNVFHMALNDWATSAIAPGGTLTMLPAATGPGELESIYFVSSAPNGGGTIEPNWLEQSPAIAVDGTNFVYGGTEDFYGNQFYGDQWRGRTDEYGIARYFSSGAPDNTTYWSAYRYFRETPMTFAANIAATWNNGPTGSGTVATRAGSLCVYYTES